MDKNFTVITGGKIVLPDQIVKGSLLIRDGRIEAIVPAEQTGVVQSAHKTIDADGMYVVPGIIDTHSDAIEKEIEPRPGSHFPMETAFYELEKKLVGHGITTIYHGLSMAGGVGPRSDTVVEQALQTFYRLAQERCLMRHRLHLRYEMLNFPAIEIAHKHIREGSIHLLSLMDHSPGQGQYRMPGSYARYVSKTYELEGEAARAKAEEMVELHKHIDWQAVKHLAHSAILAGIPVASHDDDTYEKVDQMQESGVSVCEFPMNLKTALYASERGLQVSVGAPNVVRGGSHGKNLSALEAINANAAHIICSDYYPAAMLVSVFRLIRDGMDMAKAFRLVTLNPARALKIDHDLGSLEPGKWADLAMVEEYNGYPLVRKTLVQGEIVYQSDYVQL
ncbi:alpha-D-ribose 1-methylphosphonate 5-triphosphate diphosphatase [Ktedonospora formicarum]|uniref:Alpha-D-ribose 1-methylphosphonate 5-triphosphate diphosphatase n=1 Tax=Ktedonospora formicarum TaxID=2778364 RepID=A0A8J3MPP2_9CHLR|nr:alpha-D-ribose 1-methylphosphonate 5-triphosphate diphosphatase [Ktedonospora formicarum]GHO41966.1 alpha-D-ribose 1-methylphosphonate 5-triphosphate diphosphatase [Ktedonospora formicarum]